MTIIDQSEDLPLDVKEDEDEGPLETVEDDEGVPEQLEPEEGGEEAEEPSDAHDDRQLDIDDKVDLN